MRTLVIGIGGIWGALARYYISIFLNQKSFIPWGTLTVNLLGCFILALFLTVILHKFSSRSFFVLAVSTGFTGSFTTLSTLSTEGIILFQSNAQLALTYLCLTLVGGYIFTWAGYFLGHSFLGTPLGAKWAGVEAELRKND